MALHLIPIAIGAAVVAVIEACNSSQYACHDPDNLPVTNKPGPDEFVSIRDQRKIIAHNSFSPKAIDAYFEELIRREKQVEDFFNFQSPWHNKISLFLITSQSPNNECGSAHACAVLGAIIFTHSTEQLTAFNHAAENGFTPGPMVHEMGHVLRLGLTEMPRGLEEGLAVYTEIMVLERFWPLGGKPEHVAKQIFSGTMKPGDAIKLPEGLWGNQLTFMGTQALNPSTVVFNYHQANIRVISHPIPIGKLQEIPPDLVVQVVQSGGGHVVTLYQRSISKNVYLDTTIDYQCFSLGYRQRKKTFVGDMEIESIGELLPYQKDAPHSPSGKFFPSNFCFWDSLRERSGHAAIQAIVHSMVTFSQNHVGEDSEFPLFQTVRDATGMSMQEAQDHFDRFSAPMDNASYPTFNDICWK